jgi:hypothetical protein
LIAMGRKKKRQKEIGWEALRMRGASMTSLGVVYAVDESEAIEKAVEQYSVPVELRSRVVVRPWN